MGNKTKHLVRGVAIMLLSIVLTFGGCSLFQNENESNGNLLWLLGAAVLLGQGSTCSNNSGLVICIPPGVRF